MDYTFLQFVLVITQIHNYRSNKTNTINEFVMVKAPRVRQTSDHTNQTSLRLLTHKSRVTIISVCDATIIFSVPLQFACHLREYGVHLHETIKRTL